MTDDVGFGARVLAVPAVGERVALLFAPSALLYLVGTTLVAAAFCFIIWYEFRAVLKQRVGQREHPKPEMNACPEPLRIARGALTALVLALFTTYFSSGLAEGQATRVETLEQEFTDPLTTLPQLIIRDSYSPATYGTNVQTNQVIIRPIIPRIPPNTLLPFAQLIRPTFELVTVPSSRGGSRTEFGDVALFDVAVLPWPDYRKTGLLVALGPTFVFPTATSRSAGQGAWQAGPAFGAIYTGVPGLLIGFVFQNPISFAYSSVNRSPQNTFELQPVLAFHLWDGWYLRSAEANWLMGWHRHSPTTLPLSLGIGRTFVRPGAPPMSFFVTGQWMVYRQFAQVAPQTTVNFGMTIAFPQFRRW